MTNPFEPKTICILGRQPALGLAELESLYGAEHVRPLGDNALLDINAGDINFKRLGGTIKVARILMELPSDKWSTVSDYLIKTVPEHLASLPEGKFTLGLSAYGLPVLANEINKTGLAIKKAAGRSMRIVPNKTPALNSAQVLHNKLTNRGAWELLVIKNGARAYLAQTFFEQDIEAYAARDQARPARDARVGMLPPKLAQILVNLAFGKIEPTVDDKQLIVLDPFCGTGVVLQEALLMGYEALGTDLEPRMVEFSKTNLDWLANHYSLPTTLYSLNVGDATSHKWPKFNAVACETYLGRPLAHLPAPGKLEEIVQDVNTIVQKFLKNLAGQTRPGARLCLALPAWQVGSNKFKHLPLIDRLTDMGYNVVKFEHVNKSNLLYYRESQIVARQLIVLEKK